MSPDDANKGGGAKKKRAAKRSPRASTSEASSEAPIVERHWRLADLPSSQHRAGLAGLVMMVDWVRRAPKTERVLEIVGRSPGGCGVRANLVGMRDLFDAAYGARKERITVASKWAGQDPLEVIEVEAPAAGESSGKAGKKPKKEKKEKRFVYEVVVPSGAFLEEEPAGGREPAQPWLKLWRDFVWSIMRGVPAQRAPFNARANGTATDDADDAFHSLLAAGDAAIDLASTYFLGAQQFSAEGVSFRDRAANQFLLHFWPYAAAVYQPTSVDREGSTSFNGFAIAVPDVSNLDDFVFSFTAALPERSAELIAYRPRAAVIDLVPEGGVDLSRQMRERLAQRTGAAETSDVVLGIDVIHAEKDGNNIRVRDVARVDPRRYAADEHARLRNRYWNNRFRRQRILNFLAGHEWWRGYDRLVATTPHAQIFDDGRYWPHDARAALDPHEGEIAMTSTESPTARSVEELVLRTVNLYLRQKLDRKHGKRWEDVKGNAKEEKEYGEKREKLALDAFLAVRSRTGSDFIEYFTGTLCSVPQSMPDDGYLSLSKALFDDTEKVRTLTLLALSARA